MDCSVHNLPYFMGLRKIEKSAKSVFSCASSDSCNIQNANISGKYFLNYDIFI